MCLGVRTGAIPARLEPSVFLATPVWRLATLIKKNACAALILFPQFRHLCFEPSLRMFKRRWSVSVPKYHMFYNCRRLLTELSSRGDHQMESAARPHLIFTMRVFALFRGIDLARAHRSLREQGGVCFVNARRKGRLAYELFPVHSISSRSIFPVRALNQYIAFSTDYTVDELPVSLTKPQAPFSADRVGALTTEFLKGPNLTGFTAHSTRGDPATTLILLGIDPQVIAALGDWKSYDCFCRFYDKVGESLPFTQALVPDSCFYLPQLP